MDLGQKNTIAFLQLLDERSKNSSIAYTKDELKNKLSSLMNENTFNSFFTSFIHQGYIVRKDGFMIGRDARGIRRNPDNYPITDIGKNYYNHLLDETKIETENERLTKELQKVQMELYKAQHQDIPINASDRKTVITWQIVSAVLAVATLTLAFLLYTCKN